MKKRLLIITFIASLFLLLSCEKEDEYGRILEVEFANTIHKIWQTNNPTIANNPTVYRWIIAEKEIRPLCRMGFRQGGLLAKTLKCSYFKGV